MVSNKTLAQPVRVFGLGGLVGTNGLETGVQIQKARRLEALANEILTLFKRAENSKDPALLDLDPRVGSVRLTKTKATGTLLGHCEVLQGQMNAQEELQALLRVQGQDCLLSISGGCSEITLSRCSGNSWQIERLCTSADGGKEFTTEASVAS